jgi:hypothetical protein
LLEPTLGIPNLEAQFVGHSASIFISFSFRPDSDQSLIERAQEIAEIVGERMKLKTNRIRDE